MANALQDVHPSGGMRPENRGVSLRHQHRSIINTRLSTRGITMIEDLNTYLQQVADTLSQLPRQPLERIAEALWETYERDGTILICGNGGSAASASHFACDLAKLTISRDSRRVRALALTDNVPLMTAWSNDQ